MSASHWQTHDEGLLVDGAPLWATHHLVGPSEVVEVPAGSFHRYSAFGKDLIRQQCQGKDLLQSAENTSWRTQDDSEEDPMDQDEPNAPQLHWTEFVSSSQRRPTYKRTRSPPLKDLATVPSGQSSVISRVSTKPVLSLRAAELATLARAARMSGLEPGQAGKMASSSCETAHQTASDTMDVEQGGNADALMSSIAAPAPLEEAEGVNQSGSELFEALIASMLPGYDFKAMKETLLHCQWDWNASSGSAGPTLRYANASESSFAPDGLSSALASRDARRDEEEAENERQSARPRRHLRAPHRGVLPALAPVQDKPNALHRFWTKRRDVLRAALLKHRKDTDRISRQHVASATASTTQATPAASEKATPPPDASTTPAAPDVIVKRKPGRPRKHPLPEAGSARTNQAHPAAEPSPSAGPADDSAEADLKEAASSDGVRRGSRKAAQISSKRTNTLYNLRRSTRPPKPRRMQPTNEEDIIEALLGDDCPSETAPAKSIPAKRLNEVRATGAIKRRTYIPTGRPRGRPRKHALSETVRKATPHVSCPPKKSVAAQETPLPTSLQTREPTPPTAPTPAPEPATASVPASKMAEHPPTKGAPARTIFDAMMERATIAGVPLRARPPGISREPERRVSERSSVGILDKVALRAERGEENDEEPRILLHQAEHPPRLSSTTIDPTLRWVAGPAAASTLARAAAVQASASTSTRRIRGRARGRGRGPGPGRGGGPGRPRGRGRGGRALPSARSARASDSADLAVVETTRIGASLQSAAPRQRRSTRTRNEADDAQTELHEGAGVQSTNMGQAGAARLGGDKSAVRPAAERAKAKKRSLVDSVGGQATSDSSLLLTSFAKRGKSSSMESAHVHNQSPIIGAQADPPTALAPAKKHPRPTGRPKTYSRLSRASSGAISAQRISESVPAEIRPGFVAQSNAQSDVSRASGTAPPLDGSSAALCAVERLRSRRRNAILPSPRKLISAESVEQEHEIVGRASRKKVKGRGRDGALGDAAAARMDRTVDETTKALHSSRRHTRTSLEPNSTFKLPMPSFWKS